VKRVAKVLAAFLGSVLLLIVAAVLVLSNTDWGRERVRRIVLRVLEGPVHGTVQIGRIDGNLLSGFVLRDVAIRDSAGNPFVTAAEMRTRYGLRSLLKKRVELADLALVRPVVILDRAPGGEWNYERIFPGDTTNQPQSDAPGWGDWLVFRDVRMVNGTIVVRTPWDPGRELSEAEREREIAQALDTASRTNVVRVAGGFQQVQEFHAIDARLPLLRIRHPDYDPMRFEVDSLRMVALPFRPPAATVRQLRGAFEMTGDSLWWQGAHVLMPGSEAALSGRYGFDGGALTLEGRARRLTLADVRFLYPALPADGGGSLDLAIRMDSLGQRYTVKNADLRAERATMAGDLGLEFAADTFAFYDTNLRFADVSTRLIERLAPGVELPRAGTLSGRAALAGGLRALAVDGDVTFDDDRAGRNRVVAVGDVGMASEERGGEVRREFSARNLRLRLDPVQVDLVRDYNPTMPVHGTVTGTATVNGSTRTRLDTRLDLVHLDRGARSRIAGRAGVRLPLDGRPLFVDADARLLPLALVTPGRFAPAVGLRGTATGPVRVAGALDDLRLDARLRFNDGGALTAAGRMDLAGQEPAYDVAVSTNLFNANTVVATAPKTSITASAFARGRGKDPATMAAQFGLDASTSEYDQQKVDSAHARVSVAAGLARVDTLLVRVPKGALDAGGTFGLARGVDGALAYKVAVDSLTALARWLPPGDSGVVAPRPAVVRRHVALARADSVIRATRDEVARAAGASVRRPPPGPVNPPAPVRRDSLAGALYAAGVVRGGLPSFDVRGRLGARDVVAAGSSVREVRGEYALVDGGTRNAALALGLQADSASAGGFALDSLDARLTYRFPSDTSERARGTAQLYVFQQDTTEYGVLAEYTLDNERNEAIFNNMRLRFDQTLWTAVRPGVVGWGTRGVDVDSLELRNGANGRIFVNGLIPTEGAADLDVEIDNFEIGDIVSLLQSDLTAQGLLSVSAQLDGTARAPRLRAAVGADRLVYNGGPVPDVHATLAYDKEVLTARLDVAREGGLPLLLATGTVPINLALQGVTGSRFVDRPLTVDASIDSLPLDLASKFTDAISRVRGAAVGKVAVRGTLPDRVTYTGNLSVEDAEAHVNALGVTLSALNGAFQLRGDSIVVDSLTAYSGGPIRLSGGLGIAKVSEPSFDLALTAKNVVPIDNERGRIRMDADLAMRGPFARAVATGTARVIEGAFYLPEGSGRDVEVLSANDPAVFAVVQDTALAREDELIEAKNPLLANLRANVKLRVERDTWVRNKEANVEIYSEGDLLIDVDQRRGAFTLEGVMGSERGEYSFLGKRFEIRRGSATFIGAPELDPLLQATGEYEVRIPGREALVIRLIIGGTVSEPRLSLESAAQPPISQSDLLSYLAFSRSSSSLLQFGGSSLSTAQPGGAGLVGQTAQLAAQKIAGLALGVGVSELEGNAARSLGADVFNITTTDVPTEVSGSQIGGFLRGTEVQFGKYLNTNTFVGIQARPLLLVDPDQAALGLSIEHRMRLGLRLEGSFEPRYQLRTPTFDRSDAVTYNVFGAFLIREWRF